jgi:hypothetical protein
MAALADRVKESTATTGQGTVTLAGAAVGFRSFTAAFGNGVSVYYVIAGGAEWEVGIGTTGAGTLSRDTVIGSSAGGTTKVTFSAGTKDVFCSVPASRLVLTDNLASANTANAVVQRDGSGNFAAGTITATLSGSITGNAATATALQTARNINGVSFNGTADITVTAAAGTLTGTTLASNVVSSSLTSVGTLTNLTVTNTITGSVSGSSGSTTGNAATATALQTARNINGVSFNGTADITVTAAAGTLSGNTLASGVTASSLTSVGTLSSLTVSGNLTVDTNTLFVDAANNVVCAGNATPRQTNFLGRGQLQVESASFAGLQVFANSNTIDGAYLYLVKSRAGVIGGTTVVQNNDVLGAIAFAGYDGSVDRQGAAIAALVNGSPGASDMPGCLVFSTTPDGSASPVEGMRLDANRNLGLGVTPSAWGNRKAFQISGGAVYTGDGSTDTIGVIQNGNNDGTGWKYVANGFASRYYQNASGHYWDIAPSGTAGNAITFTQAMTLDASGNLGVGSPYVVNGRVGTDGTFSSMDAKRQYVTMGMASDVATFKTDWYSGAGGTTPPMAFLTGPTERARITAAGDLLVGLTSTVGAAKLAIAGTTLSTTNTLSTFSGAYGGFDWVGRSTRIFAGTADATNSQIEFYAGVSGAINERFRIKGPGQVRFLPLASAPTTNVEDGDVYYDSGTNKLRVRAGGSWVDLH